MDQLFEEFIGAVIRRHARELGTTRDCVCLQAARHGRWLVTTQQGSGRFRLRPDVLVRDGAATRLILDTKWKRLLTDAEDRKNGVSQGDVYQLYAYANRFKSPDNLLLYPMVPGVTAKRYVLQDDPLERQIRVEFIDVYRDLATQRQAFLRDLGELLALKQSAHYA